MRSPRNSKHIVQRSTPPFSISGSALELVWVFLEPVPNTTVLTLMVFRCFPSCSSVIDHLCYACHWHVFVLVVCILCFASVFKPAALASCTILLLYHLPLLYYILLWLLHSNCLITLLGWALHSEYSPGMLFTHNYQDGKKKKTVAKKAMHACMVTKNS